MRVRGVGFGCAGFQSDQMRFGIKVRVDAAFQSGFDGLGDERCVGILK